jgi:hypothetical protein
MLEYGLTYTDAEIFRNSIPNVQVIVPNRIMPSEVWYRNRKLAADVIGTVPKVAEDLFLFDYPIRQYVKIGQDYYKVVGVVSEQTRSSFESNPAEAAAAGKTQTGTNTSASRNWRGQC